MHDQTSSIEVKRRQGNNRRSARQSSLPGGGAIQLPRLVSSWELAKNWALRLVIVLCSSAFRSALNACHGPLRSITSAGCSSTPTTPHMEDSRARNVIMRVAKRVIISGLRQGSFAMASSARKIDKVDWRAAI